MSSVWFVVFLILLGIPIYIWQKLYFFKKKIPNDLKKLPEYHDWSFLVNLILFREPLWNYLFNKSKIHGEIFQFTIGFRDIVILNSQRILLKALKDNGLNFSGRWPNLSFDRDSQNSNILFKNTEWWTIQRDFIFKVLKNFISGKQRSIEIVNQECAVLLKEIRDSHGKHVNIKDLFKKSMVNIISLLVMNTRFERESRNFKILSELIDRRNRSHNFFIKLLLLFPFLERFPKIIEFLYFCFKENKKSEIQNTFFKEIIEEHKKSFLIKKKAEDLIDVFLKEQYEIQQKNENKSTITDWQLITVGIELFIAAFEKTITLFLWSMLLMAKYPEIQNKIRKEIIDLIGNDKSPNLINKISLPYTQAVIDEIYRFSSVVPLALPHRVVENVDLDGYFIPKNSIIFPNLYACHRNKEIWERPFEFYPEHFLKILDNGFIKYTPRNELAPFGIGIRQCLGENLTKMEFYLILTSILQRFNVKFENNITEESYNQIILGTNGMIRCPLQTDFIFERV